MLRLMAFWGAGITNEALYIFFALAGVAIILWVSPQEEERKFNRFSQNVQALATGAAVVAGGYWYFIERHGHPHADISQNVHVVPVASGLIAVEAHVELKNLGRSLLEVNAANVRLQRVSADPYAYGDLSRLTEGAYWGSLRPGETPSGRQFASGELRWPTINRFSGSIRHSIEPGETDLLVFTFLLPCVGERFVRIATEISNPASENELAWKDRSFVDVRPACTDRGG